ncbi:MAG: hypothetical protein KC466_18565 [Myxococcales bacterium]|nr:hypothetical protein [Myxococcales bacterium]
MRTHADIDVTELLAGDGLFDATGHTRVKICREGRERVLRLRIRSRGVREAIEAHERGRPRPPIAREVVKPDDPLAAEWGIARPTWVNVFDTTDRAYREALARHDARLAWVVLAAGLDVPIKDDAGREVPDVDGRARILEAMGLSTPQLERMVRDIRDLTTLREDEALDFFSAPSAASPSAGPSGAPDRESTEGAASRA